MNHPTSIQWQCLLDITEPLFLSDLIDENNFNMMKGGTRDSEAYVCDTVLCAGGWAAIAFGVVNKHGNYSYFDGGNKIAQILGLDDREALEKWAHKNPAIWGNTDGRYMFSDTSAYENGTQEEATKLSDVWHHWESVRDRTLEWEEKNLS